MATSALAIKYRPKTFEEVVEQSVPTQLLRSLCESKDLTTRNFLLIGSAGCGKTTLAKIMANLLNDGKGSPIELDAASNNGVENMREIVQQARMFPVGCKYKVYILDECFPANTWVSTPSGKVQIKDIHVGDRVYNMTGQATVTQVFQNKVKTSNLISIRLNNRNIVTTKDHLFFTDCGWIAAQDLCEGDTLYDNASLQALRKALRGSVCERREDSVQSGMSKSLYEDNNVRSVYHRISQNVSDMWQRLLHTSSHKCNNLFAEVFRSLEEAESKYGEIVGATCKTLALIYLSRVWQANGDPKQRSSDSVFSKMCCNSEAQSSEAYSNQAVCMVWKYIYSQLCRSESSDVFPGVPVCADCRSTKRCTKSCIFSKDACKEPDVQSRNCGKDDCNQGAKRDLTPTCCIAWWERNIHSAAADVESDVRGSVDIRISRSNRSCNDESGEISYELQTRPRLSRIAPGDRGGWCRSSYEIASAVGCKESTMSSKSRVASVEIYQPGHNDELFRGSFSDSELHSEYVTMYDLEIDGHPSYFVEDILVHNCHALSSAAWQVLLRPIEEGVGNTIWIFCTTNPEKIPATIISRVQTFKLSKISTEGITNRLKYILDSEVAEGRQITYTQDAIQFVAKLANGGMRDAITMLDQALSYNLSVTSESVAEALNLPNYDDYFELLSNYAKRDNKAIIESVNRVYNSGVNFNKWFEGFHAFVMNIVKFIFTRDINYTVIPSHYEEKISKYSTQHATICLTLADTLLKIIRDIKSSQYMQEIALSYLCFIPRKEVK